MLRWRSMPSTALNEFNRTSGNFDGVFDFDAVTIDRIISKTHDACIINAISIMHLTKPRVVA